MMRFPGWQDTVVSEREVKKALSKSLLKYKLHADTELFEKAYGYVRQCSQLRNNPSHLPPSLCPLCSLWFPSVNPPDSGADPRRTLPGCD